MHKKENKNNINVIELNNMISTIYENINKWFEYETITIEEYIDSDSWYIWHYIDKEIDIKRKVWLWDILDYVDKTQAKPDFNRCSYEWSENYYIMEENDRTESFILSLYKDKRKSIESQNIECIKFVFEYVNDIIQNKKTFSLK